MRREAARTALLRERLSARGAEAALLLAAERGTVQLGGALRVTHYGGGDYDVRHAWHVDAVPVRDPLARSDGDIEELAGARPVTPQDRRAGLRLIRGGQH